MEIIEVKIEDLKASEYNPRGLTEKEKKDLMESIKRFGMVEPILVNSAQERKNIIIGGHQRYYICKELGKETVPVVYVNIPDLKKEQELNLRLNKNLGHWDYDLLTNFDEEMLLDTGFESEELMEMFGLNEIESVEVDLERLRIIIVEAPEAPKLKERMAFYCDNIEEYKRIVEYFKTGRSSLDKNKLLEMI